MCRQNGNLVMAWSGFRGTLPASMRANSQDGALNPKSAQPLPDLTCPRKEGEVEHLPSAFKMQEETEMMGRWYGPCPGGRHDSNQGERNEEDKGQDGTPGALCSDDTHTPPWSQSTVTVLAGLPVQSSEGASVEKNLCKTEL